MTTILTMYGIVSLGLIFSFVKDKNKTMKVFKVAKKALLNSLPSLLGVLGIVGLILGLLPPETISKLIGSEAGFLSTIIASILGAVTLIPSLIAFPLAGSLLRAGATITTISVFVTTLVMVGFVTMPLEIKILGKKFALLRNGLSFIIAFIIAIIMGFIL
ncbi:MAG: permease [Candidatus Izemoplasmatales bacterium]